MLVENCYSTREKKCLTKPLQELFKAPLHIQKQETEKTFDI